MLGPPDAHGPDGQGEDTAMRAVADGATNSKPAPAASPTTPIESLPIESVYEALGSRREGLSASEAAERLAQHGPNVLHEAPRQSLVVRLAAHFTHLMAILLWVGSVIALLAGLPQLSIAVVLVNIINGLFSFWQEFKAERATEALRRMLPVQARVLRDGREARILAEELVPGDVMLLDEGDRISADGRVVDHAELRVDQSTLTGETTPVRKTSEPVAAATGNRADLPDLVFAGTTVSSGRGKAVVVATAMSTEFGRIARLTQEMTAEPSPLQQELARLSKVVSVIAIGVGAFLAVLALGLGVMDLGEGLVFGLGMIVAFVPEGLLPTVTLSLAMGTQRMANRNALVKRLSAVETLGSTSVICTDKTGTLTQNEMTVREVFLLSGRLAVDGVGYAPEGGVRTVDGDPPPADVRMLFVTAGLACNARLVAADGRWTVLGDPTEAAIQVAAAKSGVDLEEAAVRTPRVFEVPFDSRRKRMSTIHRDGEAEVLCAKGAPRELLERCSRALVDGIVVPLDEEQRDRIGAANDDLSRRGLRVLAVARRDLPPGLRDRSADVLERDLTFLGLVAMMDPPRPEVEAAVRTCQRAGIRTVMITGDYGLTAESIARRVGMVRGDRLRIVNGDELEAMSDDELDAALADEVLFARSSPEHKLKVVAALQRVGHVVAVTGDGVNDAPALKKADIGVAMGRSGTDVAREAADMILLDDNFASIVNAVEEGRAVYSNIRRFTLYIFTSNTPEAVPFVLFALSGGRIPLALGIMAILAIDLGTDLVPALALGAERPEPGVMDRPPRQRSEHIVSRQLVARAYLFLGPLQAAAVMALFYAAYWADDFWGQLIDLPDEGRVYEQAVAMALIGVVATQIGNLFAQRAERESILRVGFFSNRLVWVGIASELVIIALIVYVPFLQRVIGTAAVPATYWLWALPFVPLLLVADELRKAFVRRRDRRSPEVTGP
jgi:magnesium-transporting ATPase (P-type)